MDRESQYIKSMEFCQAIIKRMADNSFRLKQWFLLAVTTIFTVFFKMIFSEQLQYQFHINNFLFLIPLFMFPCLDAYYLQQERLFREIYNDFSNCLNNGKAIRSPFDMKPTKEQRNQFSRINVIFSITVAPFYFIIICVLQGLFIHRLASVKSPWLWSFILPALLIILGCVFKKQTTHQK